MTARYKVVIALCTFTLCSSIFLIFTNSKNNTLLVATGCSNILCTIAAFAVMNQKAQ